MSDNHHHLDDQFTGDELDQTIWSPYYLPHWCSRSGSRATYTIQNGELHLSIPPEQSLWCADLHEESMRVSGIQSGNFAGPFGSTIGQQPFKEGLTVREEQPEFRGYLPRFGRIDITMRMTLTARSMAAFWLVGFEDQPERSGEICVAEIFGDAIDGDVTQVGMGVHKFRDPQLEEAFTTIPLTIDAGDDHTYGVDWTPDSLAFAIDGQVVHQLDQSPDYPMQLMIGVFDFPGKHLPQAGTAPAPELIVSRVRGTSLGTG